jgi:hypothetical protein
LRSLPGSRPRQAFQFALFELRAVAIATSHDMLSCLDALRWGQADLYTLIPDGDTCVRAVIESWGPALAERHLSADRGAQTAGKRAGPLWPARAVSAPCTQV